MTSASKRRASAIPVGVDRRWDWLVGQASSLVVETLTSPVMQCKGAARDAEIQLVQRFFKGIGSFPR